VNDARAVSNPDWIQTTHEQQTKQIIVVKKLPLPKNLWVDFGQIEEFSNFLQLFASFRAFKIWKPDS